MYLEEVTQSAEFRKAVIEECRFILEALVLSPKLFKEYIESGKITDREFFRYLEVKRKKMNHQMVTLADCIAMDP